VKSSTPTGAPEPLPTVFSVDPASDGLRADVFLFRELPFLSRRRVRQKIQMGESLLNGRRYSTATRLRTGETIIVTWRGCPDLRPTEELSILFEDAYLLALDKPAGMASHPMGRTQAGTVVQFARQRSADQIRASLDRGDMSFYPTLVNRLDVFTSGIVLLAKTKEMHAAMQALMAGRQAAKEYIALVEGRMSQAEGRIDLPLGRDEHSSVRVKMAARADGLPSVTTYVVLRLLSSHTLVRAFPLTGRQHQIRVHFASMGHPIVGDLLYKDERLFLAHQAADQMPPGAVGMLGQDVPRRQCLHASRVEFAHPATGERLRIESPLPADFLAILAGIE
jgi:23S rRNA pseudouridine1911/1915/1917 synthase